MSPLPEAVRDLHFDRADGVLVVASPGRTSELYFDTGNVFYCKDDTPEQRLDRVLVKWGLVAEDAVMGVVQRAGRDVRGALVREGVFPSVAAFDEFMGQVLRERTLEVFRLRGSVHEFRPQAVGGMSPVPFPTTTPNVVLEGVRRMPDADRVLAVLRDDSSPLALNPRPHVPLESLQMGTAEGYVLAQLTGHANVAAISAVSPLGHEQTLRLLYALLVLDIARHPAFEGVRFSLAELSALTSESKKREDEERQRIEAEYQRIRTADVFQLVPDLDRLPPEEAREAVHAYQSEWRSERFTDAVAREMREQLILIAGRSGEALLAVMDSARRKRSGEGQVDAEAVAEDGGRIKRLEYSRSQAQTQQQAAESAAAEYLRRAREAHRAKDWHTTVECAREATRLHETSEAYALLADALAQNPHWAKKAEEAYRRAMELNQFDPVLPVALGRIYARHGLKDRAREMFKRALDIQPDHPEAKAGLKELKRG